MAASKYPTLNKTIISKLKGSYSAKSETERLREENGRLQRQIWSLQTEVGKLKDALYELTEKCKPYLEALKFAPQKVKEFIDDVLAKFKQKEKSIFFEPKTRQDNQSKQREKRSKNKDFER